MARTLDIFPDRLGWRGVTKLNLQDQHTRILSGSFIMLVGIAIVSAFNFGYNVAMARLLGPAEFGHASAAVTLLMLVSAITLAFQLVCAKFVARNTSAGARQTLVQSLMKRAWIVGLALAATMALASGAVAGYLRLPTAWIVLILTFGIAFYVPLGVKRGALQGACAFPRLAGNFILEVIVKFGGALILVGLGFGV